MNINWIDEPSSAKQHQNLLAQIVVQGLLHFSLDCILLRRLYFFIAATLSLLLPLICVATTDKPPVHFALAVLPSNLDPRSANDAASERLNRLLYRSLVDIDATGQSVPDLATWQMLNHFKAYRFTLRHDRPCFHHGGVLQAEDVKATYDSLRQLKTSPLVAEFSRIAYIEVENARTITFYLHSPDVHFVEKLVIGICPRNLLTQQHDFSRHPIGNGPLRLLSWDSVIHLQRITDGQSFILQEVKDPTVRVLKLLKGETDLLQGDLPRELVQYLKTQNSLVVLESVGSNLSYLGLNIRDIQLRNLRVRRALAHAIDREAIIQYLMVGRTRLADAILAPEHYTRRGQRLKGYDYNPTLARQLLREAGVHLPLRLDYKTSTDAQRLRLATLLQAQMSKAGIDMVIHSLDWGTFFDDVQHGNFQLFGLTWVGIKTPQIYRMAFASTEIPPRGANRGGFSDVVLDELLAKENWQAVTARIQDQLPAIPLWYEGQFVVTRRELKGYLAHADGNWDDLATVRWGAVQTH